MYYTHMQGNITFVLLYYTSLYRWRHLAHHASSWMWTSVSHIVGRSTYIHTHIYIYIYKYMLSFVHDPLGNTTLHIHIFIYIPVTEWHESECTGDLATLCHVVAHLIYIYIYTIKPL